MRLKPYYFLFFPLLLATACTKKPLTPNKTVTSTDTSGNPNPVQKHDTDVYVAGNIRASNGFLVACYWKNGVITLLADSTGNSYAKSVIKSGSDLYIAGSVEYAPTYNDVAVYWKNGVANKLTSSNTSGQANGIAVQGSDVYVAGVELAGSVNDAVYWKNGSPVVLTNSQYFSYSLSSIAVQGPNIYAGGFGADGVYFWTNTTSPMISGTQIDQLALSGNDVYAAGIVTKVDCSTPYYNCEYPVAALWKNGSLTELTTDKRASNATGIALNSSDVYVCGSKDDGIVGYWKNGGFTKIANAPAQANAIAVAGNSVYIGGAASGYAGYWKNGNFIKLGRDGLAYSIIAVPL